MIGITVKDIVVRDNVSISGNASLKDMISLMNTNQKGVVVIVRDGKPEGMLTERDVVRLLHEGADIELVVSKYARRRFITIKSERTLFYALSLMIENNIRRLIVIDDQDMFIGVIAQKDLLLFLEVDYYRTKIQVRDIRKTISTLISLPADAGLDSALEKMVQNNISSLPILDKGKAVGIITEKDILRLSGDAVSTATPVRLCMSHPVITVTPDTPLADVVKLMSMKNIRRVVVVDKDDFALGIVTDRDLVRNFESDYSNFIEGKLKHSRDVLNLFPEMLLEILDTGTEQVVIWANEKAVGIFGMGIVDHPVTRIIPQTTWAKMHEHLLDSAKIKDFQFKKDDSVFEVSGFFLKTDSQAELGRIQMILRDISENVKISTTDALTGLYNRRFLNEFLMKEIARSMRMKKRFTVALIDLDKFKSINDTRNHAAGDAVLKGVAHVMGTNIRSADIVSRYGGDEFVIIMPETAVETAAPILERLCNAIAHENILLPDGDCVSVTASFGMAAFPDDGNIAADILISADNRLYKAKRAGGNRIAGDD
ncbi:MAG: GGDEF domain-containing protein [Thermodesulfovibrionales bacterium]